MKDWLTGLEWTGDWEDNADTAVDGVTRMDGADEDGFELLDLEVVDEDALDAS